MNSSSMRFSLVVFLLFAFFGWIPATTYAQDVLTPRVQVNQHGDFILIGNTLAHDCAPDIPDPVVGTVGACGANTSDSAPDVYWRADSPSVGQASANTTITAAEARTTAMLNIPPNGQVTHAYLYWSATLSSSGSDTQATLGSPSGSSTTITALRTLTGPNSSYQSVADITSIVQADGSGAYSVSDVDSAYLVDILNANPFAGWWMIVLYKLDSEPLRNLAIYDHHHGVSSVTPQNMTLSGFLMPSSFNNAKLGVVAMEGDNTGFGDSFSFNGTVLSNSQNPSDNFFNGTRTNNGSTISVAGDLPQLTGAPGSMSGIDLDVVDVTALLSAGDSSATVSATTIADVYFLSSLITSFPSAQPDVSSNSKVVSDVNGGALLPGDILEYTITITNTGTDAAVNTSLVDTLPAGITYVPGSLEIVSGANAGAKTDAAGDDQAEYDAANRRVVVRLGDSSTNAIGGTLDVGASTSVRFQAQLDAVCAGPITIANQASISVTGQLYAEETTLLTNGNSFGTPTSIDVNFRCVTLVVDGTGSGSLANSIAASNNLIVPDGTSIDLSATANVGSSFVGWSGAASGTTNPLTLQVDADKVITATFSLNTYTITPSAGVNGSISPNTLQTLNFGQDQTFTFTPNAGYQVADVLVDGVSVGALTSYTFTQTSANHTISVSFSKIPVSNPSYTFYFPMASE